EQMKKEGAVIVDPVTTSTDLFKMASMDTSMGNLEYKWAFNAYMADRGPNQPVKNLAELIASGKFHPRLKENYEKSEAALPMEKNPEYAARYRGRAALKKLLEDLLEKYDLDAFVYPVRSGALPKAGTWPLANGISGQSVSDYCGLPAITVPGGFTSDGLPQGVEFMAKTFEDAKLLQIAYGYEQISHHRKLPSLTPALPGEVFEY
ncbi:MAG TPA: amidase family protein, partial [Opitutaceae bacterium]|nr:amidase family protein [Opitutaceae bacterium]